MFDHIPTSTNLSREMQFVAQFADHQQLWTFILRHEKLLYIPVDTDFVAEHMKPGFDKMGNKLDSMFTRYRNGQLNEETVRAGLQVLFAGFIGHSRGELDTNYEETGSHVSTEDRSERRRASRPNKCCVYRREELVTEDLHRTN